MGAAHNNYYCIHVESEWMRARLHDSGTDRIRARNWIRLVKIIQLDLDKIIVSRGATVTMGLENMIFLEYVIMHGPMLTTYFILSLGLVSR